jgi:alpha-tubulin suppressor-like RCC1 family protein
LRDDGAVLCFGANASGQLGVGDTTNRGDQAGEMGSALVPVQLPTGTRARAITAGAAHTCALLDDDSIVCWGANADGQLGAGDTVVRGDNAGEMANALVRVNLGTDRRARAVSAGADHTCALRDDDSIVCWGVGDNGRLGTNSNSSIGDFDGEMGDALVAVDLGVGLSALAMSAGAAHTCAIRDDERVVCWGVGDNGRLGDGAGLTVGDEPNEMGDNLIFVDLGAESRAKAIAAGGAHTCALLVDNSVKCWGAGASGRLGIGNSSDMGDTPDTIGDNLSTVNLGTGRSARAIFAGSQHTCAVLDTLALKCWGRASSGRLGNGSTSNNLADSPTELGEGLPAVQLGTNRAVDSRTEPGRVTSPTGTVGDRQLTLTWSAPDDGGAPITDYVLEMSVDSGAWQQLDDGVSTATSYTVTDLDNDVEHEFRIRARSTRGDGAPSLVSLALTPTAPTTTTTTTSTTTTTTTTSTTTTTTTTVPESTTSSTTTVPKSTTTVPETTTTTVAATTMMAPPASAGGTSSPTPASPATTSTTASTTTSTTTTTIPDRVSESATETPADRAAAAAAAIRTTTLPAFLPLRASLSAPQRAQLERLATSLRDGDRVTCTGAAGTGPASIMSRLARERARAACSVLAAANPRVRTTVRVAWSPRATGGDAAARQVQITVAPSG